MKITIEFYRTRDIDDAHALVGRQSAEVADIAAAVQRALTLATTLDIGLTP